MTTRLLSNCKLFQKAGARASDKEGQRRRIASLLWCGSEDKKLLVAVKGFNKAYTCNRPTFKWSFNPQGASRPQDFALCLTLATHV